MSETSGEFKVVVELFGIPRLRAGCRQVLINLPPQVTAAQIAHQLGNACPALRGTVLRDDLLGLKRGYVFNLNGMAFLNDGVSCLRPGDSLLLLSNQAGG